MNETRPPIRTVLRDGIDEPRLAEIWQRVQARRKARGLARRALVPALVACCAVLLFVAFPRERHGDAGAAARDPLRFASGEPLSPAAVIEVAERAPTRVLMLSDGTRITLGAGGRLVPRVSTGTRLELAVERGRARFEVQPQRGRSFVVSAGALRVEVVGTVFSVQRGEQDAEVAVEHGRVRVRASDLPSGERMLGAGQSLHWSAIAGQAQAPAQAPAQAIAQAPAQAPKTAKVQSAPSAFHAAAANGEYERAYALLGNRGYARAVHGEREIDALLELADIARGAGKPRSAALALSRIIELYPEGDRSALAALTLGRLELDVLAQPTAAVRSLRVALTAGLPVALQEDALARLVDACARAGQQADAERAAEQYRSRFPDGRWRASVEQWVTSR